MATNGNDYMYPQIETLDHTPDGYPRQIGLTQTAQGHEGITKREYFAALAMQGMRAGNAGEINPRDANYEYTGYGIGWEAKVAVMCADALIAALNNNSQEKQ